MSLKPQTFGQAFKLALAQAGIRQVDLAVKTGLSLNVVNGLARDSSQPQPEIVAIVEQALDLKPGTLRAYVKKPVATEMKS